MNIIIFYLAIYERCDAATKNKEFDFYSVENSYINIYLHISRRYIVRSDFIIYGLYIIVLDCVHCNIY